MTHEVWLAGASAVAFLSLALLAMHRRTRHPLALHLGLMCVGLFAYNLAELLSFVAGRRWVAVGDAAAALAAISTFELFLGFLGVSRRVVLARRVARPYFAALGVLGLAPLAVPDLAPVHDTGLWSLLMLVGLLPGFAILARLIVRRARRAAGAERARAELLGGALLLGVGTVMTDLAAMLGLGVPRLSYVGLLLSAVLVAALTFGARIVERVRVATVLNAATVALLAVVGQVLVVAWAGDRIALVLVGTLVVALAAAAALVPLVSGASAERARTEYLLTLGRFAQQMAHDVRNPLATIKGAAQFLQEERAAGRSIDDQPDMLAAIAGSVDRIDRFIADYQRIGRVEPDARPVDVNAVVEGALRAASGAKSAPIEIGRDLAPGLPDLAADPDLLGFALENLVRNACEAMPEGGRLSVATERCGGGTPGVRVTVRDTGCGMDVVTRERALDGFFTTKEGGTGLGLAFVRRVVEAHGGRLRVESALGRGTTVSVELPVERPR
jgi:signal transduction histidine kinase